MRRVGHAACMGKKKSANRVLVGSLKEIERLQYLNVDERIILTLRLLMSYIYILSAYS